MRTSTTFTILFWIYSSRAVNNQANLYARITMNGKRVNISLLRKVNVNSWESKSQRLKGNSPTAREINLYLNEVKSDIMQSYQELKRENRTLSAELIKARYLGQDKKEFSLLDIFDYHNKTMAHKIAESTMGKFHTTQKYLLVYLKEKYGIDNQFLQNLDYEFILGFENFLRSYQSRPSQGTIGNNVAMKHMQRLKKMIRLAYDLEWIQRDPFAKFQLKFEKREREFLTECELQKIVNMSSPIERLIAVRDLFVFSCYTGMSYVDIMKLTQADVISGIDGKNWIMTKREKTGAPIKIPLLPRVELILNKYKDHPRTSIHGRILPYISNQKLNSYLKEIADKCEITKNLTFHMARHTFATTVTLSNGVPIETVSKLLGHTKITTTQIYARVIEEKISEDMNKLSQQILK